LQTARYKQILSQPNDCPNQNDQEEAHRPDAIGNPASEPIQAAQLGRSFIIDIPEPFAMLSKFG
jgi:hypothetical protein